MCSQMDRRSVLKAGAVSGIGLITGCIGTPGGGNGSNDQGPIQLGITTAAQGSSHYNMSAPIPNLLSQYSNNPKLRATVKTSEGGVANLRALKNQTTDIGTTDAATAYQAHQGDDPFNNAIDIRLIMRGEIAALYHVVREGSGIESIQDLEGKTVTAGSAGSGLQPPHKTIMNVFDINVNYKYLGYSEGGRALRDGVVDAWYIFHGQPSQNAFATAGKDLKILEFTEKQMQTLTEAAPFFSRKELAKDLMPGMAEPRLVSGVGSFWATHPKISKTSLDVISEFVRVITQHPKRIQESNTNSKNFGLEFAYADIGVSYHKGAKQYFRDQGIL